MLIMIDTLILRLSLNFTQLHFTTLSFGFAPFKFLTAPFHLTSLHFTFLHFTAPADDFRHTSFPFTSPLYNCFPNSLSENVRFTREKALTLLQVVISSF
jgi:hypothetical protein